MEAAAQEQEPPLQQWEAPILEPGATKPARYVVESGGVLREGKEQRSCLVGAAGHSQDLSSAQALMPAEHLLCPPSGCLLLHPKPVRLPSGVRPRLAQPRTASSVSQQASKLTSEHHFPTPEATSPSTPVPFLRTEQVSRRVWKAADLPEAVLGRRSRSSEESRCRAERTEPSQSASLSPAGATTVFSARKPRWTQADCASFPERTGWVHVGREWQWGGG